MKFREYADYDSSDLESDTDFQYAQKLAKRKGGSKERSEMEQKRGKGKPRERAELRSRKQGDF